ncbi:hypothetical protein GCM10010393_15450 [Streptomyces gobitricini]|uniref:Uncharacterized protein n=1 Tax=Streptomyces gobitricini TaxID=68211 RepID=A0ABN3LK94_9ACTN
MAGVTTHVGGAGTPTRFHAYFEANAAGFPERPAVSLGGDRLTYGGLDERAERYARRLREAGARPGDRVVVHARLSLDVVAAVLGVLKAGCCLVTTHPTFGTRKLVHQIEQTDAVVLVTDEERSSEGRGAELLRSTDLSAVVVLGCDGPADRSVLRRADAVRRPRRGAGIPLDEEPSAIFFTSGSSAAPKGVTVTHRIMVSAFRAVTSRLRNTRDDVILSATPIGSDFGFYNIMMPLSFGGRVVLLDGLPAEPDDLVDVITREGVTGVHAFPSLLALLAGADDDGGSAPRALPTLRYWSSTGQRLPVEHIRRLRSAYPCVALHSMYGLTECKRVLMLDPDDLDGHVESVGKPLPEVRAFLVAEDGSPVTEPGAVGELAVGGDLVMQGYWNDPEGTARSLRRRAFGCDRVFFTGDLFTRDADGFHYWTSRRDDVFSRAMFMVNPHEIEAVLRRHPGVADAAVVAVPDEEAGHVPVAIVAARPSDRPSPAELRAHCERLLDWHMVPARIVLHDGAVLPRSASGKTDRRTLQHQLLQGRSARPVKGNPPVQPTGAPSTHSADSSMFRLVDRFDAIARGADQVPRVAVQSTIRDRIGSRRELDYQDRLVERAGPLYHHFLASVPAVLEELARVGVALARLAERRAAEGEGPFTFYEADAFDGTQGRTLAEAAGGSVRTLTSSPNRANEPWFHRDADPSLSSFFSGSLFELDRNSLKGHPAHAFFGDGADAVYETAAFQFYGTDRRAQIAHLAEMLRPGGLVFFLEKLDHPDPEEYRRREEAKDRIHKARYFSAAEIARKQQEMLSSMRQGQVDFDTLAGALCERFRHVHLLWSATNFYEFVACDDEGTLTEFLELAGSPHVPEEFCFDRPTTRRLFGAAAREGR